MSDETLRAAFEKERVAREYNVKEIEALRTRVEVYEKGQGDGPQIITDLIHWRSVAFDEARNAKVKLDIAVKALGEVDAEYEIDWASKERLREFIKNQRMVARRALLAIQVGVPEK